MTPIRRYTDEAFLLMLPFYGIENKGERRRAIKTGAIQRLARVIRECDWKTLADKMARLRRG